MAPRFTGSWPDLADDPKVLEALNALADSADEREKIKKNPDKWVKDQNIKLPPKTTVTFFEGSWRVELTIAHPTASVAMDAAGSPAICCRLALPMKTTRREMLGQTSLIALGTLLPGCRTNRSSSVAPASKGPLPMPQYAPKSLPFDPTKLPGLSEKLLRSHHENNYVGAVKKLNGVRERLAELDADAPGYVLHGLAQGELAFKHSVVLHELYFGNLVGGGSAGTTTLALLDEHFGGAAGWEQRFRALGGSLGGGSGWAILEFDLHEKVPRMYNAADHTQGLSSGVPLLVLDMYEHSYHMDYGTAAAKYIDAVFANLHWEEIDRRTELALELAERIG